MGNTYQGDEGTNIFIMILNYIHIAGFIVTWTLNHGLYYCILDEKR